MNHTFVMAARMDGLFFMQSIFVHPASLFIKVQLSAKNKGSAISKPHICERNLVQIKSTKIKTVFETISTFSAPHWGLFLSVPYMGKAARRKKAWER